MRCLQLAARASWARCSAGAATRARACSAAAPRVAAVVAAAAAADGGSDAAVAGRARTRRSTRRTQAHAAEPQQEQAPPLPPPQQPAAPRAGGRGGTAAALPGRRRATSSSGGSGPGAMVQAPQAGAAAQLLPLPRVLILHTGGTLGMDVAASFEVDPHEEPHHPPLLKRGTGGKYGGLVPGDMLGSLLNQVPEMSNFGNLDLQVLFNKDSSRVGPKEWVQIARALDKHRAAYDAFLVVHGTDTLAYTASALSLMLAGFRKPIVMTGSQLPLASPRSDARQNLIDALTCATCSFKPPHVAPLSEVAVCFGGRLMRGNRAQKINSSSYQAFDSPGFPHLATLGVDVEWNERYLLRVEGGYVPRFNLEPAVMRLPIVPGSDPRVAYGDLVDRGVKGVVLEAFGVGNFPDERVQGWVPWLRQQTRKGLQVYMASQCHTGPLQPALYRSGALALEMGVEAGPQMTPECAVVKLMLCLAYPDLPLGQPLAGEL